MTRSILRTAGCGVAIAIAAAAARTNAAIIYDSNGFDNPTRFNPAFVNTNDPLVIGNLRGQDSAVNTWKEAASMTGPTSSTAVVQADPTAPSLPQDVRVDYRAVDARWSPTFNIVPNVSSPLVTVDWNMKVPTAVNSDPVNGFGPLFGIESYGALDGSLRLGGLGVDATTGEILYESAATGLTTTASDQTVDQGWHSYQLVFNYATQTYSAAVDGAVVASGIPFVSSQISEFTDADISALGEPGGNNPTATAFFDDYKVSTNAVPEPASMALIGMTILGIVTRKRTA